MNNKPSNAQAVNLDAIPADFRSYRQWVLWRLELRDGKPTKIPYQLDGHSARCNDPSTWMSFTDVVAAYLRGGYTGIGFVFTENDPFVGIDIDHAVGENGEISPEALAIIQLANSYTEFSQSGEGIHILGMATLPPGGRRRGNVEMYDRLRYFAMTGKHIAGTKTVEKRQREIDALHAQIFGVREPAETLERPTSDSTPAATISDDAVIAHIASILGREFTNLFNGDISGFPSHSEGDLELCKKLAPVCPAEQIERIFNRSKLVREKWLTRPDYRQRTIAAALEAVRKTQTTVPASPATAAAGNPPAESPSSTDDRNEAKSPQPAAGIVTAPTSCLPFMSVGELRRQSSAKIDWLWVGFIAVAAVVLLCGKPKCGKSTLIFALIKSLLTGTPFLGHATEKTGVVYLSEEGLPTLLEKIEKFSMSDDAPISFLSRRLVSAVDLKTATVAAAQRAREIGARVIVVDTFTAWGKLDGESENSAATCEQAMAEFKNAAAAHGLAVIIIHHTRKNNMSEGSDAIRGSSALAAAADVLLTLGRDKKIDEPCDRRLQAQSRFAATPDCTRMRFDGNHYVCLDMPAKSGKHERVRNVLPKTAPGLTIDEIATRTALSSSTVRNALDDLRGSGDVERIGNGTRKSPYTYHATDSHNLTAHIYGLTTKNECVTPDGLTTNTHNATFENSDRLRESTLAAESAPDGFSQSHTHTIGGARISIDANHDVTESYTHSASNAVSHELRESTGEPMHRKHKRKVADEPPLF